MAEWHRVRYYAILLIVVLAVLSAGFTYGFLSSDLEIAPSSVARKVFEWARHEPAVRRLYGFIIRKPTEPEILVRGSWGRLGDDVRCGGGAVPGRADKGDFRAVGYLSGYEPAGDLKGVTVYVPGMAYEGLNLITSGHGEEALLVDMEGRVRHRWAYRFGDAFPAYADAESQDPDDRFYRDFWRRCHLFENGDLLAIYENFGIIKLDKDSNLIWAAANGAHHTIHVTAEGLIYVLTHAVREGSGFGDHGKISDDFLTVLDADGIELRRVSVLEAFRQSHFAPLLGRGAAIVDMLHSNTVQVMDGPGVDRSGVFKRGDVLTSVRNLDVVAAIDMDREQVVWALTGLWRAQHEPTLLATGNVLVFDNKGHMGMSQVIEFDPLTQEILWSYVGTPENGFYSESSGAAYRLANGNTLIVESNSGRAFEVTRNERIVWEYYNPFRAGEDDELIATIFDVVRLGPDFPTAWLSGGP